RAPRRSASSGRGALPRRSRGEYHSCKDVTRRRNTHEGSARRRRVRALRAGASPVHHEALGANRERHEYRVDEGDEGRRRAALGRIKVELYPANQLGQIPRTVEGVALGTIEATLVASGFFAGIDPRYLVFDAVGLFDDMSHGNRVFQDPEIRKRLSTFSADKGIEPLIVYSANPNMVLSHKAIRTLADFKGQKIRVPGAAPLHVEPFRHFGASALSML